MTASGVDSPSPASTGAASLVGRVLSERYRIESILGEGGMGAVYLAQHVLMRKRLAVKVLHPEMTRMPEMVARFEREAMAAAHIEHPNVAAATDFGKLDDGSFFLVLEYVEGTSLRDLIAQGPLANGRALHIAYQMASALARAHALGIVHRDLKPENVMLVERDGDPNFVKVLDFGIAKVPVGEFSSERPGSPDGAAVVLTQLGMVYGTPEYMAPEQALGQAVDARADIYALGVILYEMLTGVRPFEAESKVALLGMKVTSDPPSLASKNPELRATESIEALVRRMLDKEAANRFQEAREVLEAIENGRMGEARTEAPMGRMNLTPTPASARYRASLASVPRTAVEVGLGSGRFAEKRAQMMAWAQGVRGRLPGVLARVPPLALIAGAALVMLLFLLVSFSILGRATSNEGPVASGSAAAPSPPLFKKLFVPPTAPADALASATTQGTAALEELSTRYSEDPAVWRALVRSYTKDKRGSDAVRAIGKLVALNERAADDDDVSEAITSAAQGPSESSDAAFAMMESGLGPKGPDILYDLSTTKGLTPRTSARVKQTLAKPDVKARMSPALAVAIEVKNASGCEAKRALLSRAKEQGDSRVLGSLRAYLAPRGCGFLGLGDCWSCMRRDNALGATIAAIEERTGK